ncbi:MAG: DUF4860 domain-containing protein [Firmicutes bacterium]|nr:DUF4860 domain-containing protein [Bacillota bacterium]
MRFENRGRHAIDLLFPIALFFVFAASALIVLTLAADIYGSTTGELRVNDENRTALSYISEKIRQSDVKGGMEIAEVEGTQCLVMSAEYNGQKYATYIYEYEGTLKELFARDDAPVSLKSGMDIMAVSSLSMEKDSDTLYRFTTVDSSGKKASVLISERSVP